MKDLIRSTLFATLCFLSTFSVAQTTVDTTFYRIKIEDYYGASGHAITHIVARNSVKVITDCDFVGCQEELIYEQMLADSVASRFWRFISLVSIDTLRDKYETMGLDGLVRLVTLQHKLKPVKYILLQRFHHPTVDNLVSEIKNLITDEKYR